MSNPIINRRNILGAAGAGETEWSFLNSVPSVFTHQRLSNATMFNSAGLLQYAPHQLLENANWSAQTSEVPSGWVDVSGTGFRVFTDAGGFFEVDFTASANRPYLSNNFTAEAGVAYTAVVFIESVAISSGNLKLLDAFNTSGTDGEILSTDFTTAGFYAVPFLMGVADTSMTLRTGLGVGGNSTGTMTMSRPSIVKGVIAGLTIGTAARLDGEPLGKWIGTDDGDEPRFTARVGSHVDTGGTFLNEGYLTEEARTELALHNQDMTNAVWVKGGSMSAAKDATGLEGITNSASTLTAGAANDTITQTVTVGSAEHAMGVHIKRKTGTGTILITDDNFTTTTDVTSLISTGQFTLVQTTQTQANPVIGIQIVTSGDEIEVDIFGVETGQSRSSPIPTVLSSVTRAADSMLYGVSGVLLNEINFQAGTIFAEYLLNPGSSPTGDSGRIVDIASDALPSNRPELRLFTHFSTATRIEFVYRLAGSDKTWDPTTTGNIDGTRHKTAVSWDSVGGLSSFDGVTGATEPAFIPEGGFDRIGIGCTFTGASATRVNGHVRIVTIDKAKDSQGELNGKTT